MPAAWAAIVASCRVTARAMRREITATGISRSTAKAIAVISAPVDEEVVMSIHASAMSSVAVALAASVTRALRWAACQAVAPIAIRMKQSNPTQVMS